jgi:hypothetical protein
LDRERKIPRNQLKKTGQNGKKMKKRKEHSAEKFRWVEKE